MAKLTPLRLPSTHPDSAVLSKFADALNTRLKEIEALHDSVQAQINKLIKDNALAH